MRNKKGLEMSFGWIFSIIVGAAIISLAIYGVTNLSRTERTETDSKAAQQLGTLLQPLETSSESASKPGAIEFSVLSRIYNECTESGTFGLQELRVAQSSGIGEKWAAPGMSEKSQGKYVFSADTLEGKKFYTLVKPINLPFKTGDAIAMWSRPYCFINTPGDIEEEIISLDLNKSNIRLADSMQGCQKNSTKVCFSMKSSECDISVDIQAQKVTKGKKSVYYEEPFLYGAIMSESDLYECQIKRVLKRAAEMAEVYERKSEIIASHSQNGCSAEMQVKLSAFASNTRKASSKDLSEIYKEARELGEENSVLSCSLWKGGIQ